MIVGGSAVYVETVRVTAVFSDVLDIFFFGGRGEYCRREDGKDLTSNSARSAQINLLTCARTLIDSAPVVQLDFDWFSAR